MISQYTILKVNDYNILQFNFKKQPSNTIGKR